MIAQSVRTLVALNEVEPLAHGLDHPESVIWNPGRQLLFSGGEAGQIFAIELDGQVHEIANTCGLPLGLALNPGGTLMVCDARHGALMRVDVDSGRAELHSLGPGGKRLTLPNHVAVDEGGTMYVTDSGTWGRDDGAVVRIDVGGNPELWSSDPCAFPNGCALGPDGLRLLVVESRRATVRAIAIESDGKPGGTETVARFNGAVPDGIVAGAAGPLLVGCFQPDRVYRVSPYGVVRVAFDDPWGMTIPVPTGATLSGDRLELVVLACHGDDQLVVASSAHVGM